MRSTLRGVVIAAASLLMAACATVAPATSFSAGDWVLARWQEDRTYYWPAMITSRNGDEVSLQYDDGDFGTQHIANVRPFDWGVGTQLECRWQNGPTFFPGRIAQMEADRYNIFVHYDDGDEEATNTSRCRAVG